jgi:hypothetical protein
LTIRTSWSQARLEGWRHFKVQVPEYLNRNHDRRGFDLGDEGIKIQVLECPNCKDDRTSFERSWISVFHKSHWASIAITIKARSIDAKPWCFTECLNCSLNWDPRLQPRPSFNRPYAIFVKQKSSINRDLFPFDRDSCSLFNSWTDLLIKHQFSSQLYKTIGPQFS